MIQKQNIWNSALEKTRKATFGRISSFLGFSQIGEQTWEDLESQFVLSDLGISLTQKLIKSLQKKVHERGITKQADLTNLIKEDLESLIISQPELSYDDYKPFVIVLVGVNGSGKTTTAAKLASLFLRLGKKVGFIAGDTFRAAAVDQLEIWAKRLNINITSAQPGSDPGAVVFDGIKSAIARKMDIVIVDTAGRLHTRFNLMEELKKVMRAAGKAMPDAPHAVWLIIDATTGQNALRQAQAFTEAVHVTGIILAKLDSSSKGGMVFAIQDELGLPVLFAGLGENMDDFCVFDKKSFIENILN